MLKFKRRVTAYFNKRELLLRNLSGGALRANDDFAELHVLVRLVKQAAKHKVKNWGKENGKRTFKVAAAPSPDWAGTSYFALESAGGTTFGARTGLQVEAGSGEGTVELDLVLVALHAVAGSPIGSSAIASAAEVKTETRPVSAASEIIGKAVRVFGLPIGAHSDGKTAKYCLVSASGATQNTEVALKSFTIHVASFNRALDAYLKNVITALGLA